jgi:hypothetical protein
MPHRYQAPKHTSSVFTSTGEKRANPAGVIELGDDAPQSDHAQLQAAGCTAVQSDSAGEPSPDPKDKGSKLHGADDAAATSEPQDDDPKA